MKFLIIISLLISISVFADINITVFAAADNSMIDILSGNMIKMKEGTAGNDAIVNVLADTPDGTYHILMGNGQIDTLSYQGNINAGDPSVISDFFINSYNNFPADKFITVLWDHGNGWYESKAILYDNNPNDFISVVNGELAEIFRVFTEYTGKRTDLLIFDACDMHSIEVLYEIKEYVQYSLGSSIRMPYSGCPYTQMINYLCTMSIEDAGKAIADDYYLLYIDSLDSLQMSFIDLDGIDYISEQVINNKIGSMQRVNALDVSIPDSLLNNYTYNVSDKEYLSGMKLFSPAQYSVFLMLYKEYLKLEYQSDYDMAAAIFRTYSIPDTIPPEYIDSMSVRELPYSNIEISFEDAYDLSGISSYIIHALLKEDSLLYDFDYIDSTDWGILSDMYCISKPHSLYTDTFNWIISDNQEYHIIEINIRGYNNQGILIIETDLSCDSFRFNTYDEWSANVFNAVGKNLHLIYSGNGDHVYIDDICIIGGNNLWNEQTYITDHILHKIPLGHYAISIEATDGAGNTGSISPLYHFEVSDSLIPYVYPNPAVDEINIVTDIRGDFTLSIYSSDGHMIMSDQGITDNGIVTLHMSQYNPCNGIYFFTINGRKGKFSIIYD